MDTLWPGIVGETPIVILPPPPDIHPIGSRVLVRTMNIHGEVTAWGGSPLWYIVRLDDGQKIFATGAEIARAMPFLGWRPVLVPR